MKNFLYWFKINSIKANPGKFQFMILGKKNRLKHSLKIGCITVREPDEVELLEITIDKALNFKKHIKNLFSLPSTSFMFHALRQIRKYLTLNKAKLLGNAFIDSQFNYAPIIWMFYQLPTTYKTTYLKIQNS